MPANPIILATGTTSGAGAPGIDKIDLIAGETINLVDTEASNSGESYAWFLDDVPVGAAITLLNSGTATPSFLVPSDSENECGTILIRCVVNSIFVKTIRLRFTLPNTEAWIPHFEETTAANDGGNTKGWHKAQTEFMRSADKRLLYIATSDLSVTGLPAPIGSLARRDNAGVGELWQKVGAADDAWSTFALSDPFAIHGNVAGEINTIALKTVPVAADMLLLEDSETGFAKKKVALTNFINVDKSLQDAYDFGQSIVIDGVAVSVTNPNADAANVLELNTTALATGAALAITNPGDGPGIAISNGGIELGIGQRVVLDDDGDTYIEASADDFLKLWAGGTTIIQAGISTMYLSPILSLGSLGSEVTAAVRLSASGGTGIYFPSLTDVAVTVDSTEAVRWTNTQDQVNAGDITVAGQVFAPKGIGTDPGFSFTGATGFGLTRSADDLTTFMVASGQSIIGAAAAGVTINKNMTVFGSINASAADTWNIGSTGAYYSSVNAKQFSMREQATTPGPAGATGYLWVKTAIPNTLWFTDDSGAEWQVAGLGADGSTLDASYDYAGAGAGRSITADAGAVVISNPNADANSVLELNTTALGTGNALTITNDGDGPAIFITNGAILAPDGSNAENSYSFASSPNSGLFYGGASRVVIGVAGSSAAHFLPNQLRTAALTGSESVLQVASQGDTNTGHFWTLSDILGVATGGVEAVRWDENQDQTNAGRIFASSGAIGSNTGYSFTDSTITGMGYDGTLIRFMYHGSGRMELDSLGGGFTKTAIAAGVSVNPAFTVENISVSTAGVPVQNSAGWGLKGSVWDTTTAANRVVHHAMQMIATSGITADVRADLVFSAVDTGVSLETGRLTSKGQWLMPIGSAALPPFSFVDWDDFGMYKAAFNTLGFAVNGSGAMSLTGGNLRVAAAGTEAAPAIGVGNSIITGIWEPTPEVFAISTNSSEAVRWDLGQDQTNLGRIFAVSGATTSTTGYSFADSSITGMGYDGSVLRFTYHGSFRMELDSAGGSFLAAGLADGDTGGWAFTNASDATVGVQIQRAPIIRSEGTVWDTTTVASRSVNHMMQMVPTPGITADIRADMVFSALDTGSQTETGRLTSKGQWLMPGGSAVTPPYAFDGFEDMGPYKGPGNTLAWSVQGIQRMSLVNAQLKVVAPGTAATPAFGVGNSTSAGLWEPGTNDVAMSADGVEAMRWDTSQNTIIPQTSRFVFDDDEDTYITANGADDAMAHFTGGAVRFTVATSIVSCIPAFSVKQGSAAAPGLRNNGDADTGLYFPVVGEMGATASGVLRQLWTSNGTGDPVSTISRNAVAGETAATNLDNVGLSLTNFTAATIGQNQNSPALLWEGAAWQNEDTTHPVRWSAQLIENTTGTYASTWELSSLDSDGWTSLLSIVSGNSAIQGAHFETHVMPEAPGASPIGASYDLGSSGVPWRFLYTEAISTEDDITVGGDIIITAGDITMTGNIDVTGDIDADGGFRRSVGPNLASPDGSSSGTLLPPKALAEATGWFVFARPGSVVELTAWAESDITAGSVEVYIEKSTDGGDTFAPLWGTSGTGAVSMSSGGAIEVGSSTVAKGTNVFAKDDVLRIRYDSTGYTGGVLHAMLTVEC